MSHVGIFQLGDIVAGSQWEIVISLLGASRLMMPFRQPVGKGTTLYINKWDGWKLGSIGGWLVQTTGHGPLSKGTPTVGENLKGPFVEGNALVTCQPSRSG